MQSLAFPTMLSSTKMLMLNDNEATKSNLKLLLLSDKNSLFGDPYFGTSLTDTIFTQNGYLLENILIDKIYTAIKHYLPQIIVERKDIFIKSKGTKIYAEIKFKNRLDFTADLYTIELLDIDNLQLR